MTENTMVSHTSLANAKMMPRLVVVFSAAFVLILFSLHFLEPEFDPSWRMISEYELGQVGWLMSLAFFCWGSSVLALRHILNASLRTRAGRIAWWWLLLIGVVLFGAGIFITNPITDTTVSLANSLHTLCGTIVIMTFPIAASLAARSLAQNPEWQGARPWLFWVTLLLWLSMFLFFGSISISKVNNPAAGRVGPDVLLGWPNRLMVVVYNVWLILVAWYAARITR